MKIKKKQKMRSSSAHAAGARMRSAAHPFHPPRAHTNIPPPASPSTIIRALSPTTPALAPNPKTPRL